MSEFCFWILTNGTIVKPNSRHILAVVSAPEVFGETADTLQETFAKYGQGVQSNFEGEARAEVLKRVIGRNHIRIRKNIHPRNQHWSVQLWRLTDERHRALSQWASYITPITNDQYSDVIIHQFYDGSRERISLNELFSSQCVEVSLPTIISESELKVLHPDEVAPEASP